MFNDSLNDNSFIASDFDELFESNSNINFQTSIPHFQSELDTEIINALLQNPRPEFIIESHNINRGRHILFNTRKRRREHTRLSTDNIITEIQTHFFTFIISFVNDSVKAISENQQIEFLNFAHNEKRKVNFDYLNELKNSTIGELIKNMNISSKYTRKDINTNKKNLKVLEETPFFKSLFDIKYLELFSKYYNNKQPLKEVIINDQAISLSPKTESFYHLLEKNKLSKSSLIEVAEKFYLNDININKSDDSETGI